MPHVRVRAWWDGAVEPANPGGHGSYGVIVRVEDRVVFGEGVYLGDGPAMSNNVAEYAGAIAALWVCGRYWGEIHLHGDSRLVVQQLTRRWAVHGGLYLPYYEHAQALFDALRPRLRIHWIPREQNQEADALSKQVLIERGVRLPKRRRKAA